MRTVSTLQIHMEANRSRSLNLLIASLSQFPQLLCGIGQRVRSKILPLSLLYCQPFHAQPLLDSLQVPQIETLQLMACDTHQSFASTCTSTQILQLPFHS